MFEWTPEYWQGWRESSNPYRQLKSRRDRELAVDLLQLVEGDTVLEVGCGYGWTTQALVSAATLRWVGVDASLAMLRALRDKVLSGKNGVVVADALRLPFTDAAFDKVLCNGVLPHLEDEVAALREMVRVLSPGGLLVVSMNNALAPYALPVQLRNLPRNRPRQRFHFPSTCLKWLAALGLRTDRVKGDGILSTVALAWGPLSFPPKFAFRPLAALDRLVLDRVPWLAHELWFAATKTSQGEAAHTASRFPGEATT